MERPVLNRSLDAATFRNHYYLKEELVRFCRASGLPAAGGKSELTERIACFLENHPCKKMHRLTYYSSASIWLPFFFNHLYKTRHKRKVIPVNIPVYPAKPIFHRSVIK